MGRSGVSGPSESSSTNRAGPKSFGSAQRLSASNSAQSSKPSTILKTCIVYVDVISAFGDDSARSLIADMLENLGARVLGSVGRTLTHLVYKNGHGRTLRSYRQLPEPKPLVVGMEWVVQCAKKGAHENETPYLVDPEDMNTSTMKVFCFILALQPQLINIHSEGNSYPD
ncbi:hypothetical protein B0H13DRAFT_1586969 [Mycena leptocephala]|nr:hypothetical protein B0H13DRAFT_1586969 [Mycena leptocephala]